jgi:hypothetical protein
MRPLGRAVGPCKHVSCICLMTGFGRCGRPDDRLIVRNQMSAQPDPV